MADAVFKIVVGGERIKISLDQTALKLSIPTSSPLRVTQQQSKILLRTPESTGTGFVFKGGIPGPQGPAGPAGPAGPQGPSGGVGDVDFVCIIKPDSTLSYTSGLLTRVDYVDGRYKTLSYDANDRLVTVACVDPGVQTVTKTLGYDGLGQLISVSTEVT